MCVSDPTRNGIGDRQEYKLRYRWTDRSTRGQRRKDCGRRGLWQAGNRKRDDWSACIANAPCGGGGGEGVRFSMGGERGWKSSDVGVVLKLAVVPL